MLYEDLNEEVPGRWTGKPQLGVSGTRVNRCAHFVYIAPVVREVGIIFTGVACFSS